ncbi:MAG: small multi-drug export protein [Dehalococcoidales bacterium]|nr:small multi-drug export protein [Dehalococcoidales bacterium]
MIDAILDLNLTKELLVIILAAFPIIELRGAIPTAIGILDFSWYYALLLAIIGNMLPVPFILLLLETVTRLLNRVPVFKKWLDWLFERTRKRSKIIQKYKRIGLILFVAIPLPFTGAWTGSLAAVLLGISFKQAFFSIFLGVIIAGVIVTCLTLLGWIGAIIAGIALCSVSVYSFLKSSNNGRNK